MSCSGSQTSARPPAKPNVLKPIDSSATLPVRIIRSAQEILRPYFCLIGQSSRRALSRLHVVRPAVQRREALLAGSGAAAAVADAVRAGAVPGHADEQRPVVAEVGRPPFLRVRHQGMQVLDHGVEVEALEFLRRSRTPRPSDRTGGLLVEDLNVQLVRPPVAVGPGRLRRVHDRAFARACRRCLRPSFLRFAQSLVRVGFSRPQTASRFSKGSCRGRNRAAPVWNDSRLGPQPIKTNCLSCSFR